MRGTSVGFDTDKSFGIKKYSTDKEREWRVSHIKSIEKRIMLLKIPLSRTASGNNANLHKTSYGIEDWPNEEKPIVQKSL